MIDEQVKENNQDKQSWMLTKIHVSGEDSLYFCIGASFLSGMLLCPHTCTCRTTCQYAYECELSELTLAGNGSWIAKYERYIDSSPQKHWNQSTNPCYLTEPATSKWSHNGAPRMSWRKERQEESAWGRPVRVQRFQDTEQAATPDTSHSGWPHNPLTTWLQGPFCSSQVKGIRSLTLPWAWASFAFLCAFSDGPELQGKHLLPAEISSLKHHSCTFCITHILGIRTIGWMA